MPDVTRVQPVAPKNEGPRKRPFFMLAVSSACWRSRTATSRSAPQMLTHYFRVASDRSDHACQLMAGHTERATPEVELLRLSGVDVDKRRAIDNRSYDRATKQHWRTSSAKELFTQSQGACQLSIALQEKQQAPSSRSAPAGRGITGAVPTPRDGGEPSRYFQTCRMGFAVALEAATPMRREAKINGPAQKSGPFWVATKGLGEEASQSFGLPGQVVRNMRCSRTATCQRDGGASRLT